MLKMHNVDSGYEQVKVLHGVSLEVGEGESVAVVGANGAGKTTTLRVLMRLLPMWRGSLHFADQDISSSPAHALARLGIGYVPEGRGVLTTMTVRENLEMGAQTRSARSTLDVTLAEVCDLFPALTGRMPEPAGNLSGGQQQMLSIGRALMCHPRLLVLDEPSLGLAPTIVDQVFEALENLKRDGQSILVVEQNVKRVLKLCSRAYVLEHGRVLLAGPSADVESDPRVRKAYLGL